MPVQIPRAVWLLGFCQCILWGVLYYSFSALLVPMESSLGLSRIAVTGAFSFGLGAMAIAAPVIGRWLDAGYATQLTRVGSCFALAGLLAVAFTHGLTLLYSGWFCIGVSMAMLLYEPAFALVVRAIADEGHRVRSLAAVTVLGGLASAIFVPLLSVLIEHWTWRTAVLACMGAVLLAAWTMERHIMPALPAAATDTLRTQQPSNRWPPFLWTLVAIFAAGTLASMALTTLLIPLLLDRGVSASIAALVLAALGLAQLPGRIWLLHGRRQIPTSAMAVVPIGLQILGILGVVLASSPEWITSGVFIFGLGAGFQTLARPWIVQKLYGISDAARWNGEVARVQGFARAAAPVAVAAAAWLIGTPWVLICICGLLVLTLPLARRLPI